MVVGCDRDIGITIVNTKDKEDYLFCLNGPSSPLWHKEEANILQDEGVYDKTFEFIVDQIEKNIVNAEVLDEFVLLLTNKTCGDKPTSETCPFGN